MQQIHEMESMAADIAENPTENPTENPIENSMEDAGGKIPDERLD